MKRNHRDQPATTGILYPRAGTDASPNPVPRDTPHIASHLVLRATRRLEIVCLVALLGTFVLWFLINLALGMLDDEFRSPSQWVPPVTVIVMSMGVLVLARRRLLPPSTLVRVGLAYEIVVAFAIACGSYLGAFVGLTTADLQFDRIGLSTVVPWTMVFTVLVPARPREALAALIVSNSAVPLLYFLQAQAGAAPQLGAMTFVTLFVVPNAVVVAVAYTAARVLHQLGVEVRQAHEMGSYRLETLLGRGGMGEVWRASHRTLARPAAIKLIRHDALVRDAALAGVAIARFEREAQVIASLQSPHTIELYDFGTTDDGTLFYVMELLDGVDLEELVRRFGPLPATRVVHILRQVCASLAEAHRRGVIHRDIKPANIYLCRRGIEHDIVKVLDFGLVKQLTPAESAAATLTRADAVAGTPHYMAPEVALDQANVDGRADLYALGCVAFWLLTGRVVFEADTPTAAIVAHVHREPPPPSSVSAHAIPPALDHVVLECLAKDPSHRPRSAEILATRLSSVPLPTAWTEEEAAQWWQACHPEAVRA